MITVIIMIILIKIKIILLRIVIKIIQFTNYADGTAPKPPCILNSWENPDVFSPVPPLL